MSARLKHFCYEPMQCLYLWKDSEKIDFFIASNLLDEPRKLEVNIFFQNIAVNTAGKYIIFRSWSFSVSKDVKIFIKI